MMQIIGRDIETAVLEEAYSSKEAELIAVYGRRRIGKTYLIRSFFIQQESVFFHVTGLKDGSTKAQLEIFANVLTETFNVPVQRLSTWMIAFDTLTKIIAQHASDRIVTIFLDELPWMATPRSRLLQALDHFWNTKWCYNNNIKVVICGSAASWMLDNIVNAKGGLHNRITRKINLQPFTLPEAKQYLTYRGVNLNNDQILELYMAIGGVPHYLREVKPGLSAQQIISRICFSPGSLLLSEYDNLLASLFKRGDAYAEILEILASYPGGADKKQITKKATKSTIGGRLTSRLDELEAAGFIKSFIPYGKQNMDVYYKLIDEYSLFYLKWIAPNKQHATDTDNILWEQLSSTSGYKSWVGYAFEALCFKHIKLIKQALQLDRISTRLGTWRYIPKRPKTESGAQIDLIFDRFDRVISLCEIKYTTNTYKFDKSDYEELKRKQAVFQELTKCNKQIFWHLITTNPVKRNSYFDSIIMHNVAFAALF